MTEHIERRLELPASPEEVWDAVTADGWLAERVELELRPGGDARFSSGDQVREGWVEEALAPRRLAFWWAIDEEPATRVELTIEPYQGGCSLRVAETRPLDVLDLVGVPLPGIGGQRRSFGPALVAA